MATSGSMSANQAEEAGHPVAWAHLSKDPDVVLKIVTKPVTGLAWKDGIQYTYFYAYLFVNGHPIEHKSPWSRTPRDAMSNALDGYIQGLKEEMPYASDLFEGCRALRYHETHTSQEYWVIPGMHGDA